MIFWRISLLMVTFTISHADEVIIGYCNCVDSDTMTAASEVPVTAESMTMISDYSHDCTEILQNNDTAESGDYLIHPNDGGEAFHVYCDMDTDGGGWTVFQRREDGSVDFYRGWSDYKSGFGNVTTEHWLGNDKIHRLTSSANYELRIDLTSLVNESRYAQYDNFRVGDEDESYKLIIGSYSGNAGDSLIYHNNQLFTTYDQDNDPTHGNCAEIYKGAWWHKACYHSNLNGLYVGKATDVTQELSWVTFSFYGLKLTEMKMRRL